MNYEELMNNGTHVLLFSYYDNFLTAKEGYINDKSRLYFYVVDHEKKFIDMYKTRQININPGVIRSRALWFKWDGTDQHKRVLAEDAAKIFIAHYNDKIHKLEKDLDDYLCNEKRLKDILKEIQEK